MFRSLLRHLIVVPRRLHSEYTVKNVTKQEMGSQPPSSHTARRSKVILEAEEIVGYSKSFVNQQRFFSDDKLAEIIPLVRKKVGSDHPLLSTAKNILYNKQNNLQPWGLVILLVSKSIRNDANTRNVINSDLYQRQRILAELTEMIRTGHLVHKGLVNIPLAKRSNKNDTKVFGNKIRMLVGDYLIFTGNGMLAKLKNQDLSYIISSALRDLSEGEFFGEGDVQNLPLPGDPESRVPGDDSYDISCKTTPLNIDGVLGSPRREWTVRSMLGGASLLGRGCQGAMLLADKSESCQNTAYLFGCHVGLAWQAASELQKITSDNKELSLVSAPILFALNDDPKLYEFLEIVKDDVSRLNRDEFMSKVLKTDAVERTRLLYEYHAKQASDLITSLGSNECVNALKKIVHTL